MRWFVEISNLGKKPGKPTTLCVEATQWQPALQRARALRGDDGPLSNFSIELLDDGYRAIDPSAKLKYVVKRAPDDATLSQNGEGSEKAGSAPPPAPESRKGGKRDGKKESTPAPPPPVVEKKESRPPTPKPAEVKEIKPKTTTLRPAAIEKKPSAPPLQRPSSIPAPRVESKPPPQRAESKPPPQRAESRPPPRPESKPPPRVESKPPVRAESKPPQRPEASLQEAPDSRPPGFGHSAPSERNPQRPVASAESKGPRGDAKRDASSVEAKPLIAIPHDVPPPPPAQPGLPKFMVQSQREENPTARSPLHYREQVFVVPMETSEPEAERLVRDRFVEVKRSLESVRAGKLVNLAVFDHVFQAKPLRRPLVTLTWKDWRGDVPEVRRASDVGGETPTPLARAVSVQPAPRIEHIPIREPEKPASAAASTPPVQTLKAAPPPQPTEVAPKPPTAALKEPLHDQEPAQTLQGLAPLRKESAKTEQEPVKVDPKPAKTEREPAKAEPKSAKTDQAPAHPSRSEPELNVHEPAITRQEPAISRKEAAPPAPEPEEIDVEQDEHEAAKELSPVAPALTPAVLVAPKIEIKEEAAPSFPTPSIVPPTPSYVPPVPVQPEASQPPPPPAPKKKRLDDDDLLAELFEAMSELSFHHDSLAGAEYVLGVALEKIPSEVGMVSFFDINKREFVVARQIGGLRSALGYRQPEKASVAISAMRSKRAVLVTEDDALGNAMDDRWFAAGIELRSLICAPIALGGRYLGLIELANPSDETHYREGDGHALTYVGQQFGEFVAERGVVIDAEQILESAKTAAQLKAAGKRLER